MGCECAAEAGDGAVGPVLQWAHFTLCDVAVIVRGWCVYAMWRTMGERLCRKEVFKELGVGSTCIGCLGCLTRFPSLEPGFAQFVVNCSASHGNCTNYGWGLAVRFVA